jgi:uncharacterized repeat protein (TIGR03833 family)
MGREWISAMGSTRDGRSRAGFGIGSTVDIVQKQNQRNGKTTRGVVAEILTNSPSHPHGIKVRLRDGKVGRVAGIVEDGER